MILVGARAAHQRDLTTRAAAVLGIGVGDTHAEFVNAVNRKKRECPQATNGIVGHVNTIQSETALIASRAGDLPGGSCARLQREEFVHLASQRRKELNLRARE